MKHLTLTSFILFLLFTSFATLAHAQGFVPLAPISGLTDSGTANAAIQSESLAVFFNNLYKYLIGLSAVLAVIMIIWGGLEISTQDSVSNQEEGKEKIRGALFGLALVLSPVLVFTIINPQILNLSIGLEKLNVNTPQSIFGSYVGTGSVQSSTDATTGCAISGAIGILQFATCPSRAAAQTWGQTCTGQLSTITDLLTNTTGTVTSARISCAGSLPYLFIDVHTSSFSSSPARLSPLGNYVSHENNGVSAMQFLDICGTAGLKTCISDDPSLSSSVPCLPAPTTGVPAGTPGKCYVETLSCKDASFINTYCSNNPGWRIFQ